MDSRTAQSINRRFNDVGRRMARPQTGIVTDDSPLTIETGNATITSPYKQSGWTPAVDDLVLVLRWQDALVVIPIEPS